MKFTLTPCSECAGRGRISHAEGGFLECPKCTGAGVSLANEAGTIYAYAFPSLIAPLGGDSQTHQRTLRYILGTGIIAIFVLAFLNVIATGNSPSDIFWRQGWPTFVLGVSGLASMYGFTLFEHHQTSQHSLGELPETDEHTVDLFAYSNPRLRTLLPHAAALAAQRHSREITDEILFATLLRQPRIQVLLERMEQDADAFLRTVDSIVAPGHEANVGSAILSIPARERFIQAFLVAETAAFPYVDLEDMLLAYARDPRLLAPAFKQFNMTEADIYAVTRWYAEDQDRARQFAFWQERGRSRPSGFMNRAWTSLPTPFLDRFSLDITAAAGDGAISGTIRTAEVTRALEILGSGHQNSVILLGEPGVGRGSILNGIAERMLEEKVPEPLKDKRLVKLDAVTLLAATDESAVQRVLEEVMSAGNVILAIPDLQVLAGGDGALTAATLLSNALAQGHIQVITTATYADYHRHIERHPELTQAIAVVEVAPASIDQTIATLEAAAPDVEGRHKVLLTFHAIQSAAELADRYLADLAAPSGALAILDEAASSASIAGRRWVRRNDIEEAIEKRTNVPIRVAEGGEKDTLLNLEDELHKRVVGQVEAVAAVSGALRRARAGLANPKRPIASFLFAGPTGVGKTETAKAVGDLFFKGSGHFIRFDMSEFQDATSVYRLIGEPNQVDGGELTQAIREHPYALVLLDEIEKADPNVMNLFLQLLDDGRLTENSGRTVSFTSAIIVATSNAASTEIARLDSEHISPEDLPRQTLSLLQAHFKPEFLNRFDAVVPFHPLREGELDQVIRIMLTEVVAKAHTQGITLEYDDSLVRRIGEIGYDVRFGARPLRRTIQDKVEGLLATKLLDGSINRDVPLRLTGEMIG
jgi:ATP-dependent Clp protease ATP-binding subunit ClpC